MAIATEHRKNASAQFCGRSDREDGIDATQGRTDRQAGGKHPWRPDRKRPALREKRAGHAPRRHQGGHRSRHQGGRIPGKGRREPPGADPQVDGGRSRHRPAQDAPNDQGKAGQGPQDRPLIFLPFTRLRAEALQRAGTFTVHEVSMHISEDRISHIAHKVIDKLWQDYLADFPDEPRALNAVKDTIAAFFAVGEEIDQAVRKKLASYSQAKVPGSRDWEILYQKFYREEQAKRKW